MAMRGGRQLFQRLTQAINGQGAFGNKALDGDMAPFGVRHASQLAVKTRMKSVKNIQKITKAMKMVAASKLRGAQAQLTQSRGIWEPFTALLGDTPGIEATKNITVCITSDKGLCGGINSNTVKYGRALNRWLAKDPSKERHYVIIGEKGKAILQRDSKDMISLTVTEYAKVGITYALVSDLVDEILKTVQFDVANVIFNRFQSVISFKPTVATVLSPELLVDAEDGPLAGYEFEGAEQGAAEFAQDLAEFHLATVLYSGLLENAASEQGARMSAMDSSTRNASDMLDRLTLSYNRSRQASITTELIEIISGAAALESSQ